MSPSPRLFVDAPLAEAAVRTLDSGQSHYLVNVMRRGVGDLLRAFNDRDGEFEAIVESASKKSATIRLGARLRHCEAASDVWLLFAPVKRDAVDLMVRQATELGVACLQPVATERTNTARLNLERLRSIATEAAEQSGRLSVPDLRVLVRLGDLLASWTVDRPLIFCDEAGDDPETEWGGPEGRAAPMPAVLSALRPGPLAVLIGPEGGFSPKERSGLRAAPFVRAATLGPRILRADTAAIAALTLVQALAGAWRRD